MGDNMANKADELIDAGLHQQEEEWEIMGTTSSFEKGIDECVDESKKCSECHGDGKVLCGHDSHYIDSMSACDDPSCNGVAVDCLVCDGSGLQEQGNEDMKERKINSENLAEAQILKCQVLEDQKPKLRIMLFEDSEFSIMFNPSDKVSNKFVLDIKRESIGLSIDQASGLYRFLKEYLEPYDKGVEDPEDEE